MNDEKIGDNPTEEKKETKEEKKTNAILKTQKEILKTQKGTNKALNTIAGSLTKLVDIQQNAPKKEEEKMEPEKGKEAEMDETYPKTYFPPKYRDIMDEMLGKDFEGRVTDFDDRTEFQFDVFIPKEYSSLSQEDKEKGVKDVRTRIIPRALGENGVRDWCKLIRTNLNRYFAREGKATPFK
tara:strand:- start:1923 stop:2468 length:546 start_codon:yes stop_codon:yes gene_type:complete